VKGIGIRLRVPIRGVQYTCNGAKHETS